ncbi:hypothetical protein ROHU_010833 [Labeo rohita]|uniref:Uncharacterized protein n=1 Tax=Labeo rohita TaxID=84645 RepID=A0A498M048_LABRO|nr:hypothetical protein ROHU_010833 [Labeo rohita]
MEKEDTDQAKKTAAQSSLQRSERQFLYRFGGRYGTAVSGDQMKDAALSLHNIIKKAFLESSVLPWPPTADELKASNLLPKELDRFLTLVLSGASDSKCEKTC